MSIYSMFFPRAIKRKSKLFSSKNNHSLSGSMLARSTPQFLYNTIAGIPSKNQVSYTTVLYPNKIFRLYRKMANGHFSL